MWTTPVSQPSTQKSEQDNELDRILAGGESTETLTTHLAGCGVSCNSSFTHDVGNKANTAAKPYHII